MTFVVFSARIGHLDPDALDVTRKSGRAGLFLAPSWHILKPALEARRQAQAVMAECMKLAEAENGSDIPTFDPFAYQREAENINAAAWAKYKPAFLREMETSRRVAPVDWKQFLQRRRVVLLCYCVEHEYCHRTVLRAEVLPALGAIDGGELVPATLEVPRDVLLSHGEDVQATVAALRRRAAGHPDQTTATWLRCSASRLIAEAAFAPFAGSSWKWIARFLEEQADRVPWDVHVELLAVANDVCTGAHMVGFRAPPPAPLAVRPAKPPRRAPDPRQADLFATPLALPRKP